MGTNLLVKKKGKHQLKGGKQKYAIKKFSRACPDQAAAASHQTSTLLYKLLFLN